VIEGISFYHSSKWGHTRFDKEGFIEGEMRRTAGLKMSGEGRK